MASLSNGHNHDFLARMILLLGNDLIRYMQVGVFLYVALVSMMTELQGKNLHSILLNTAGKIYGG